MKNLYRVVSFRPDDDLIGEPCIVTGLTRQEAENLCFRLSALSFHTFFQRMNQNG